MTATLPADLPAHCWKVIGVVGGDRSCPALVEHVHCRNCPVFAAAGRGLLERVPPDGYLDEWTVRLAESRPSAAKPISLVVFRIGPEWLALDTAAVVEVCEARPVLRLPHRRGALAGVVSIRGEVQLCVSLHELFDLRRDGAPVLRRMLLIAHDDEAWAIPADEVHGVVRFEAADVGDPPMTLTRGLVGAIVGVMRWGERSAGWLRADGLFPLLRRSAG